MEEEEATQPLTQLVPDELRVGGNQSVELDDDSLADILCILHPASQSALDAVALIAEQHPECTLSSNLAEASTQQYSQSTDILKASTVVAGTKSVSPKDIALRLSTLPKDPIQGFCFGRNAEHNDFRLTSKRISHIHFKIYVNEYGAIMLQDSSRNGTYVDGELLRYSEKENDKPYRRTLEHGSVIKIPMMPSECDDVLFFLRIPRREGEVEEKYENNLNNYFARLNAIKLNQAKADHPSPPVLFPYATSEQPTPHLEQSSISSDISRRAARTWKGGRKYNVVKKIGQGTFASVYKITQKSDGKAFAAKELDKRKYWKDGKFDSKLGNEMKIMMRIHHENIVKFIEHIEFGDNLYIIMELIPGGDLLQMITATGSLAENRVRDVSEQLLSALGYLHSRSITHRDIKPDNIMLSNHDPIRVKLTDFGLSKMVDNDTFMRTFCGTLLYCAPEVYHEFDLYDRDGSYHPERNNRRSSKRDPYTKACDLWSLAGVLFYALCGLPPFAIQTSNYRDLLHAMMTSALDIRPLQKKGLSDDCIRFLKDMLQKWPEQRPSVEKLQSHSWIMGNAASQSSVESEDEVDFVRDPEATEPLAQSASHLSLQDRLEDDDAREYGSLEEIDRDNLRLSLQRSFEIPSSVNSGGSSASESYAFMRNGPDRERLFGELGASALGSSGAIPNDGRLNLPMSTFGSGQSHTDSDASNLGPNESSSNIHSLLRNATTTTRGEYSDLHSYQNSPSLMGAESVFGHLQVRSPSAAPSPQSEMAASPKAQSPEGNAPQITRSSPSFVTAPSTSMRRQREEADNATNEPAPKRQKSIYDVNIPPTFFWKPDDMTTWHNDYPKLKHGELKALEEAAAAEGRKYVPPRTTDTPSYSMTGKWEDCNSPTPGKDKAKSSSSNKSSALTDSDSFRVPNRILAKFVGEPGSGFPSIVINVTEQYTSWGRGSINTQVYPQIYESKVPKYAIKLVLSNPSGNPDNLLQASDSIFYLSTKTYGLQVNGIDVPSHDSKQLISELKNWAQLKHGDVVTVWGKNAQFHESVSLRFNCYFGASKQPRSLNEPVTFMPEGQARAALEAIASCKDMELYQKDRAERAKRESAEAAGESNSSAEQQHPDSSTAAQAVTAKQPDSRTVASASMPATPTRSDRPIAKPRSGGLLARVRGSGVYTNSPLSSDNHGEGSSSSAQPSSARPSQ